MSQATTSWSRIRFQDVSPFLPPIIGLAIGAIAWEIAGRLEVSYVLPPFTDIVSNTWDVWRSEAFRSAALESLESLAIAWPLSIGLGLVVGLLMGRYRLVEWMLDLYVNIFLSLPLIALIPIILLLFGLSQTSMIVIVFLYTFFVVVVNTSAGVRSVESNFEEMARSFGANEARILWRVIIPGALPLALTGVRIATGRAFKGVIIGEQLVRFIGLGGLIQRYGGAFRVEDLWALIFAVGLSGLIAMQLVQLVENFAEKRLPRGRRTSQ
ncbi:MAG TPA: ABC transporter permease subunit [Dehalococcoidia bacterium]|nr:ABC transporter permease subunit [Dehalococcoidia bacterium]